MSRRPALYQWNDVVAKCLPQLSKPMAACLALWSLGMILASLLFVDHGRLGLGTDSCSNRSSSPSANVLCATFIAQRPAKRRHATFHLLIWVPVGHPGWHGLSNGLAAAEQPPLWRSMLPRFGQRFVVLAVSVLYRGDAHTGRVEDPEGARREASSWRPEWQSLLQQFRRRRAGQLEGHCACRPWACSAAKWLFPSDRGLGLASVAAHQYSSRKFRPQGWYHWLKIWCTDWCHASANAGKV